MKLRKLLFTLLFLICSHELLAQSIYEIEYNYTLDNNVKETYKAFLYRYEDGTGYIRVRYFDLSKKMDFLVDMDMKENYGRDKDNNLEMNKLYYQGMNPYVIMGDTTFQYSPDVFWFKVNPQTNYFEPWAVMSKDVYDGKQYQGVISNIRLLQQADLTKEFVSQYFVPEDGFYQNLFDTKTRSLTTQQKAIRLHLIVVANTNESSIGSTCAIDKDATKKLFSSVAEFMGIQYDEQIIFGNDFTKDNVDKAMYSLNPGPDDIVVFYYSGHGFSYNNDNNLFPYIDLRDKEFQHYGPPYTYNIEDIFNRIKQKGARFNLVISDCCNTDPTLNNVTSSPMPSTRGSSIGWSMENCRDLFLNPKRMSILMTAASKGQLSAGNGSDGGFFTFQLRQSLEKSFDLNLKEVSWDNILQTAQKQTIDRGGATLCPQLDGKTFSKCAQTPLFRSL